MECPSISDPRGSESSLPDATPTPRPAPVPPSSAPQACLHCAAPGGWPTMRSPLFSQSECHTSGPPRPGPTQHRPLPRTGLCKEPTVLAEALLTAAHLGPGRGGPGRGGLCLIVFRHQLQRLESQTAERGPCSPLEQGQTPGFFPGKVHLGAPNAPSLSLPPLYSRHLACHQLSMGPEQTAEAGRGFHHHPLTPPGHCQAQGSTLQV